MLIDFEKMLIQKPNVP